MILAFQTFSFAGGGTPDLFVVELAGESLLAVLFCVLGALGLCALWHDARAAWLRRLRLKGREVRAARNFDREGLVRL